MLIQILEIFTLVAGLLFIVLQIRQSNWMWPLEIAVCAAAIVVYADGKLWASVALNTYNIVMAIWGIFSWLRDSKKVDDGSLHLNAPTKKIYILSVVLVLLLGPVLIYVLRLLGDASPVLDGIIFALSVIATWWLANSYLDNWVIWFVADIIGVALCVSRSLYWMAALYAVYIIVAVFGYFHWRNCGKIVE